MLLKTTSLGRPLDGLVVGALMISCAIFVTAQSSVAQQDQPTQLRIGESRADLQRTDPPPVHRQPVSGDNEFTLVSERAPTRATPLFVQLFSDSKEPLTFVGRVVDEPGAPFRPLAAEFPEVVALPVGAESSKGFASAVFGPIGTEDHFAVPNDQTLTIAAPGYLDNDIDLDGEALTAVSIPDNVDNGTLAAFPSGSFTYTPNAGFVGADSFTYVMRDASFNLSDPVTVVIDVLPAANRTPVGTPDAFTMLQNTTLVAAPPGYLANDIDQDGEALTGVSIPDNVVHGSLAAFADGSFTYTPDVDFAGTDSFTYQMRDASFNVSDPVTATVEVFEGNRPPIGVDDAYATVINTPLTIAAPGFLANDYDLDGEALTATAILEDVANGTLAAFPSGSMTYTPDPGFFGTDQFVYRMRDASLNNSDSVFVTIEVVLGGGSPLGVPDTYVVANDDTLMFAAPGILANDIDRNGEALTVTSIIDNVDHGTLAAFPSGSFTYVPDGGYVGPDQFIYEMRDASLNLSGPVLVSIDVLPRANRDPIGTPDQYATLAGATLSIPTPGFLWNDIDLDGEALTAVSIDDNVDNGSLAAFPSGTFTYTPDPGFLGTDTFTYRMRDEPNNLSDPILVTIHVLEGNRDPLGIADEYAVLLNTSRNVAAPGFLMNDIDLDGDGLTATEVVDNVDNGSLVAFPSGTFTYTPNSGFIGIDQFFYRMRDDSLNLSNSTSVMLRVIDPNEPELPVELISFVGVEDDSNIVLSWTTASETNNTGFDVEHRMPAQCESEDSGACVDGPWTTVGFVDGAGSTLDPTTYTFVVDDPGPGRHAFRLRQLDVDGTFSVSPEIEVLRGIDGPAEISQVYPNPFSQRSRLEVIVAKDQDVQVELFDIAGRRAQTLLDRRLKSYDKTIVSLSAGNFASGAYLVRIVGDNFAVTRRAILSR